MRPAGFLDHRVSALPLYYFNRYSQRVETEQIYGERWLRWIYGSPLGRVALHALVKRSAFSRWYGWRMDSPASRKRVAPFIRNYGLDSSEFLDPVDSFQTFNEFFYRRLKPSARPIDPRPEAVVFPADGRHLGFADVSLISGIFVKGETLSLTDLLQDTELATDYRRGTMIISPSSTQIARSSTPGSSFGPGRAETPTSRYSIRNLPFTTRNNSSSFS